MPELVTMQVRAIFEAAVTCQRQGVKVRPKIMIPIIAHTNEAAVLPQLIGVDRIHDHARQP